jgi:hypothetical protein
MVPSSLCIPIARREAPSLLKAALHALQALQLHDRVAPHHDLSQVLALFVLRFLQDHVQEGVVPSQGPDDSPVPVERDLEPLVLSLVGCVSRFRNRGERERERERRKFWSGCETSNSRREQVVHTWQKGATQAHRLRETEGAASNREKYFGVKCWALPSRGTPDRRVASSGSPDPLT